MAYDACCLWCLGYPEQALSKSQSSMALARELGHPFTLADVVCFCGCVLSDMCRDYTALKKHAEELSELSGEMVEAWLGTGLAYQGIAIMAMGQIEEGISLLNQGLARRETRGTKCYVTEIMSSLPLGELTVGRPENALKLIERILIQVEKSDERYFEAEILRQKAQVLLKLEDSAAAEATLINAIEVARKQEAKSWELRAATSLARLWKKQCKIYEAQQMLKPIFDWFDEGFDTPDLLEARALLEEVSEPV